MAAEKERWRPKQTRTTQKILGEESGDGEVR